MLFKGFFSVVINVVVLEIAFAAQAEDAVQNDVHQIQGASTYTTIDEKVAEKLEELRLIMDVGDPERGIPKMDPFELLKIPFNLDEPLITVDGQAYEVEMKGAKSFIVNSMSTKLLPPQTTFDINFPSVWIHANSYSMRGHYMKLLPIIATGEMDIYLYNLNVKGHAKLGIKNGSPQLNEFIVYLDTQKMQTNLRGIQGSAVISQVVNKLMSDFGPSLMRNKKEMIAKQINATVVPLVNQQLANVTLQDLINLLG